MVHVNCTLHITHIVILHDTHCPLPITQTHCTIQMHSAYCTMHTSDCTLHTKLQLRLSLKSLFPQITFSVPHRSTLLAKRSIKTTYFCAGFLLYICKKCDVGINHKERGQKKNGIMWEKFPSGGPPPPPVWETPVIKKSWVYFSF